MTALVPLNRRLTMSTSLLDRITSLIYYPCSMSAVRKKRTSIVLLHLFFRLQVVKVFITIAQLFGCATATIPLFFIHSTNCWRFSKRPRSRERPTDGLILALFLPLHAEISCKIQGSWKRHTISFMIHTQS